MKTLETRLAEALINTTHVHSMVINTVRGTKLNKYQAGLLALIHEAPEGKEMFAAKCEKHRAFLAKLVREKRGIA